MICLTGTCNDPLAELQSGECTCIAGAHDTLVNDFDAGCECDADTYFDGVNSCKTCSEIYN